MTVQRNSITFIAQDNDISEPITKFGGKPFWLTKTQWPLSRSTQKPMKFIAQIDLNDTPFNTDSAVKKMVYLFITEHNDVDSQWDHNSGENAVIIQSSDNKEYPLEISVSDSITDELINENLLYNFIDVEKNGVTRRQKVPVVYTCEINKTTDPELLTGDQLSDSDVEETYVQAVEGHKFGGTPYFIQNVEYPEDDPMNWSLLLQLEDQCQLFELDFGMGTGFLFINKQLDSGKFLFQC